MTILLKPNELQILELLFDDLTTNYTIRSLSKQLNQDYAQTYRIIQSLEKKSLIILNQIGKSKQIFLDWNNFHEEFIISEIARTKHTSKIIRKIISKLILFEENICIILFGSYSNNTQTKNSDIDLLIILENDEIKSKLKNKLSLYNCDFNFVTSSELLNMWTSSKLNIGNELLKNHKILIGYDYFIKLLFQKYNN